MIILLFIVLLAIYITIQYNVSRMFENIALDKGYGPDAHPFAMCFWLGIVGYIYVAAMPKLSSDEITKKQETDTATNENEYQKDDKVYNQAIEKMDKGNIYNLVGYYKEALELFHTIPHHKNSSELIEYCEKKIKELEK